MSEITDTSLYFWPLASPEKLYKAQLRVWQWWETYKAWWEDRGLDLLEPIGTQPTLLEINDSTHGYIDALHDSGFPDTDFDWLLWDAGGRVPWATDIGWAPSKLGTPFDIMSEPMTDAFFLMVNRKAGFMAWVAYRVMIAESIYYTFNRKPSGRMA